MYGVEVLYTMLRLKVANPDHVFIARGNHEDVSLVARYGFLQKAEASTARASMPNMCCALRLPARRALSRVRDKRDPMQSRRLEPGYNPRGSSTQRTRSLPGLGG